MKKKLLSLVLVILLLFSAFHVQLQASAQTEADRIKEQILSVSNGVHSSHGGSYNGWCGAYVKDTMNYMGIINTAYDTDVYGNGNQFYGNIQSGTTSTGYRKIKYSGTSCLYDIVNANGGANVYNIVVSWANAYGDWNPDPGHVCFIHAIIDNYVYLSDSYNYDGKQEGEPLVYHIDDFMRRWNGMYGYAIGAVHFAWNSSTQTDTEPPTISDGHITSCSGEAFTFECYLNDNVGVEKVWLNIYGPNGTMKGYEVPASNGVFTHTVYTKDYAGPGEYAVHIYVFDAAGNETGSAEMPYAINNIHAIDDDIQPPTISNVNAVNCSDSSFTVQCDLNDNVGVTRVWLNIYGPNESTNGYEVAASNGVFSHTIYTKDYAGPGEYVVHIYAFDAVGNQTPYALNGIRAINHDDIGESFYATITHVVSGNYVTVEEDGNVDICSYRGNASQYWKFIRQSDGSYRIKSASSGKSLDVAGGRNTDQENIQVYEDNDTAAQYWDVYKAGDGYQLKAKCTNCVMEMNAWNFFENVNVVAGSRDGSGAEIFAINKVDYTEISKTTLNVTQNDSHTVFTWETPRCATNYNVKIWYGNEVLSGEAPINLWNPQNNTYTVELEEGNYTAYIESYTPLGDYTQSDIISFSVKYPKTESDNYTDSDETSDSDINENIENTSDTETDTESDIKSDGDNIITYGLLGDVDNDGEITANDALIVLRASVGLSELTPSQSKLADGDGDGTVTASDALEILRCSSGFESETQIGKIVRERVHSATTIFVKNQSGTEFTPRLYFWGIDENCIWPGVEMTDKNGDGWYEYTIPTLEKINWVIVDGNGKGSVEFSTQGDIHAVFITPNDIRFE